jgi:hypothetical protein
MEDRSRVRIAGEDAIENDHVEMDVEVQAPKSLYEVDGTALPMLDPAALRPCAVAPEDGLDGNAPDRREYVGFEGGQSAQLVRQRQNVLAHRHIGENSVHDGGSRIGHAPPRATRAHGSRLTRERNEEIMTARIAPRAREPLGEDTTFEVGPELGLDVAGEATVVVLAGVREKRFEMLAYKTVENGLGRTAGQIGTGERGHGAVPFADRVPPDGPEIPPAYDAPYLSRTGPRVAADTSRDHPQLAKVRVQLQRRQGT